MRPTQFKQIPEPAAQRRAVEMQGEPAPRQVVSGIAEYFAPEALIGANVVVVANLKPRKLMGLVSQGMVLAAHCGDRLVLVGVNGEAAAGSKIS